MAAAQGWPAAMQAQRPVAHQHYCTGPLSSLFPPHTALPKGAQLPMIGGPKMLVRLDPQAWTDPQATSLRPILVKYMWKGSNSPQAAEYKL